MQDTAVLYQTIVDTSQEGAWLIDAEARTTYVNRRMAEMLGYTVEEMLGRAMYDFMDAAARAEAARNFERRKEGVREQHDFRLRRKDGTDLWTIMSTNPVLGERGEFLGALAMVTDITERKQAESQLREREMQLAAAQRVAHLGSWDWDVVANKVNRSDELCRIFGLEPQKFPSTSADFLSLLHPEDRDHAWGVITAALRERRRLSFEYRIVRPDGSTRTLHSQGEVVCDASGSPVRMIGVAQDITERRRAEMTISALSSLGHRLSSAVTREAAASIIAQVADDLLGWDACSLDLYSPERDCIYPVLNMDVIDGRRRDVPPAYSDATPSPMARRVIEGGGQLILREGAPAANSDLVPFGDTTRPSASLMFVPVRNGKRVIGVLSIQSYAANFYSRDDLKTLQALADHCGGALERIESERALRQSEALFRLLVKSVKDYAIFTLDGDGHVTSWNEGAERILGYREEEILGQHVSRFFTPEDVRGGLPEAELRKARAEGRADDERWQVRKDGARFWAGGVLTALSNGHAAGFVKVMRDDTERKALEEELRVREERLNAFFTSTPAGLAILDGDLRYVQINETLARLNGVPAIDHIGKTVREVVPSLVPLIEPLLRKVLETGEPEPSLEMSGEPDGNPGGVQHVVASFFPLKGAAGKQSGVGVLLVDQTERKRAEEQLKGLNERLRALSARMQSVREEESTRIAREIHDELGQLLTSLLIDFSWLEDKLDGAGGGAPPAPLLEKVRSMEELVDLTIDTVRRIARELKPALLDDFGLAAAVEWHSGEFEKRTGIECRFVSNLEDCELPPDYSSGLFRIFQEALTNVARHANATRVEITLEEIGGSIVLEVRDDGRGISEGELAAVHSLGLLGLRERARLLGGEAHIEGAPGKGTKVTVHVPLPRGT